MSDEQKTPSDDNQGTDKTPIKRKSENKRAYRIRKKPEQDRTDAEKEWLAKYETTKHNRGVDGASPVDDAEGEPDTDGAESADEIPDAPPPPPPPRIDTGSNRGSGMDAKESDSGDWRRKYRSQAGAAGREKTVLAIAAQWKEGLRLLNEQIAVAGKTPLVNLDLIWNDLVITVDDVLPEKIRIKSSHIAAIGTTVVIAQRVYNHKAIVAAYESRPKEQEPIEHAPFNPPQPVPDPAPNPPEPAKESPTAAEEKPDAPAPIIALPDTALTEYKPGPNDVY
jgi:hypothetical protein